MSLGNTYITSQLRGQETKTVGSLTSVLPSNSDISSAEWTFTDGTAINQAQKIGSASLSLASGASSTLDFSAFPGLGGNVNFTSIKALFIRVTTVDPLDLVDVGDDSTVTNPWTSPFKGTNVRVIVSPGGGLDLIAPSAAGFVVDGTHKALKFKNSGTNVVTVTVVAIGTGS